MAMLSDLSQPMPYQTHAGPGRAFQRPISTTAPAGGEDWFGANAPSANTGINGGGGAQNFGHLSDPNAWMQIAGNPEQSFQWIKSQYPDLPDDTARYYATVIQGQPGANPTEQAGSANYYLNMIREREYGGSPSYVGSARLQQGGGMGQGGGNFGASNRTIFNAPSMDEYMNSPGTLAGLKFGERAIQSSAAAKGTLLTGGTLKALAQHGIDYGGTGYNDYADQKFRFHQGNFGNLSDLARMGQPR